MCLKMLFIPVVLPEVADWEAGSGSYFFFFLQFPTQWGGGSSPTMFPGRR